ncbi:MAG: hypothetical protein PWR24_505 [Desulfonauticus sp.]|jgi:glycosyltransferase involved in cell wall biosynthesis|nr:MAG: Glycosyl transferase group 1 [Desulfonauticus sp. 38_4375]MDK2920948.1 hypothetical protein [Desulfonauticus sp.]
MVIRYFAKTHIPSHSANSIQIVNMVNSLSKFVKEIYLYIPFKFKRYFLNLIKLNFHRYGICYPGNLNVIFLKKDKLDYFESSAFAYIEKKIKNFEDLFFTRSIPIAYFLAQKKKKFIYESHVFSKDKKFKYFRKFVENINSYNYGKVIAISEHIFSQYQKEGLKKDNIEVFPDGISNTFFKLDSLKKDYIGRLFKDRSIYKKKIVLYVGSLRKEKGPFFLLEIAKYMPELNFVIIGGDKRKVQYIKELSLSKGIKNCYVHAYIDYKYVPYCLMEADILIMPYLKTGELIDSMSPLKMFEYLATGKPILASDLSSIRSILVHKVNSFLFEAENIVDCIEKIREILSLSTEQINLISRNAINTAKQYTWDKRAEGILKWYYQACE